MGTQQVGHTPGPWMMDEHDKLNSARAFGIVRDIGPETDEPDSPRMTEVIAEVCDGPTAAADARLIAAAPALAEALRAIHHQARAGLGTLDENGTAVGAEDFQFIEEAASKALVAAGIA